MRIVIPFFYGPGFQFWFVFCFRHDTRLFLSKEHDQQDTRARSINRTGGSSPGFLRGKREERVKEKERERGGYTPMLRIILCTSIVRLD